MVTAQLKTLNGVWLTHLDDVLLFGDGLIRHFEAQRILQSFHQQQITALDDNNTRQ